LEVVKFLLQYGANVNSPGSRRNGLTALQAAAWKGYLSIAQLLVAFGADVGAPDQDQDLTWSQSGLTALNAAASRGHLDIVQLLLEHYQPKVGESLSAICDEAATQAREQNKWAVVELLQNYQREPGSP
jgi:ankyrin repeat protein